MSEFLDGLVGMFRLQAAAKGIDFVFRRPNVLPYVVFADEKRLRQILINLLSNAIKFTQAGVVQFIVHYRSPVAEFEVTDTVRGFRPPTLNASLRRSSEARWASRSRKPEPASA